jgi:hypothetical protein
MLLDLLQVVWQDQARMVTWTLLEGFRLKQTNLSASVEKENAA